MMIITYPARPVNGGPFLRARPKPPGDWYYEPKYNGWRALINGFTGEAWNRHGQPLTIGAEFQAAIEKLGTLSSAVTGAEWWDCEGLERRHNIGQGCLVVLDWVPVTTAPDWVPSWKNRNQFLLDYLDELDLSPSVAEFPLLSMPPSFRADEAAQVWEDMQTVNRSLGCDFYEGLVAKQGDSLYPQQLRSPEQTTTAWIKHRWQY